MRTEKFIKKKTIAEKEDEPYMFESLFFILLMLACVGVLIYGMVEIVIFLEQNVNVNPSP